MTDAKKRKFSAAPATSALTEAIALPTFLDSSSASSLRFATIASASAWRRRDRSFEGVFPHGPSSAALAASTARSTSASPAMAARPRISPVAGSRTSRDSPEAASADSPLMKSPCPLPVATATENGRYPLTEERRPCNIGSEIRQDVCQGCQTDTNRIRMAAEREENEMSTIDVEAARIPDRDQLLQMLRDAGLDAQPHDELGIQVECSDEDSACDELLSEVEGLVIDLGAMMIPMKHEGVIYLRPPVS